MAPFAGSNYYGKLNANVNISMTNELGYATKADCVGNPNVVATDANTFNTGCEMIRTDILTGNNLYYNTGTLANPVWLSSGNVGGVSSLNALVGAVVLLAGSNVTLTPSGQNITISTSSLTSPLSTKGDIWGFSTVNARIPVGTNTYVLTADSTQPLGLKWAAPSGSSGLTVGTTTITSGTNTNIEYNNNGVLGEYSLTGTGTAVVMATSPTIATPTFSTNFTSPLWKPASDSTTAIQITKADGSTTILNVDTTNGRVGIGTTTPSQSLEVNGIYFKTGSGGSSGDINVGSSGVYSWNGANRLVRFNTNGSVNDLLSAGASLAINYSTSDGGVGTSPYNVEFFGHNNGNSSYVHINGNLGIDGLTTGNGGFINQQATSRGFLIQAGTSQGSNYLVDIMDYGQSNHWFYVAGGGNVGIGTNSPTNILSISGQSAQIFWLERNTTANTAGSNLSILAGGATSGATNKSSGILYLGGTLATGSGQTEVQILGSNGTNNGATTDITTAVMIDVINNKIGLYGATPVIRATTGGSAAAFVANTSLIANDTATWGGYTIGQVVQALQNLGILT